MSSRTAADRVPFTTFPLDFVQQTRTDLPTHPALHRCLEANDLQGAIQAVDAALTHGINQQQVLEDQGTPASYQQARRLEDQLAKLRLVEMRLEEFDAGVDRDNR